MGTVPIFCKINVIDLFQILYPVESKWTTNTYDSAAKSGACVTGGQRVLKTAFSEIVLVGVDNNGSSHDGVLTVKYNESVTVVVDGDLSVRLDISHVTDVSLLIFGTSVVLIEGVVVATGGDAALFEITELVDMEPMETLGEALDSCLNSDFFTFNLGEADDSVDVVTFLVDNAVSVVSFLGLHLYFFIDFLQ